MGCGKRCVHFELCLTLVQLLPETDRACADVHFLEASSLSGDNVEAPFLLCARSILLSIESGALDPEKAGSGVSYGDRALRRVNSSSRLSFGSLSGGRRKGSVRVRLPFTGTGRCC